MQNVQTIRMVAQVASVAQDKARKALCSAARSRPAKTVFNDITQRSWLMQIKIPQGHFPVAETSASLDWQAASCVTRAAAKREAL